MYTLVLDKAQSFKQDMNNFTSKFRLLLTDDVQIFQNRAQKLSKKCINNKTGISYHLSVILNGPTSKVRTWPRNAKDIGQGGMKIRPDQIQLFH